MNNDHAVLCSSVEWAERIATLILPAALGGLNLGDDVLEIGPGYGASTAVLADAVPHLTAVEVDGALAAELRDRFPGVTVIHGSGDDLPFDDHRFSAAVCFTMLHHVHSVAAQDALFAEVHRVLAPGAVFAGSDSMTNPDWCALHADDICVPVDPAGLPGRLRRASFRDARADVVEADRWFTFSARA